MLFKSWIEGYAQWVLERKLKKVQRKGRFHNYDTAKTLAILFDSDNKDEFSALDTFVKELKNKGLEVFVLVFNREKECPKIFEKCHFQTYCSVKKDFNFYRAPKTKEIQDFINKPFNVLIDLSLKETYSQQYVTALSKAEFKVGAAHIKHNYCDFFIQLKASSTLRDLIQQIDYYFMKFKIN